MGKWGTGRMDILLLGHAGMMIHYKIKHEIDLIAVKMIIQRERINLK